MTQPDLFEKATTRPKPVKPTHPTTQTLLAWRRIYEARQGKPLTMPSSAAWGEAKAHCKRLNELIPDPDTREAFLETYLHNADHYERDRDFPLRLALRTERFQRLARIAERMVAERRRVVVTPSGPVRLGVPPTKAVVPDGFVWRAEILTREGAVAAAKRICAATKEAAESLATTWLVGESGRDRSLVAVRVTGRG